MPNEYVHYAEVTAVGRIGARTRSLGEESGTVQVQSNDPITKSKSFQVEPGKFLPTNVLIGFLQDCDFDYILDVSLSYYTYKLVEVDESQHTMTINGAPEYPKGYHLDIKLNEPTMVDPATLLGKGDQHADA